MSASATVLVDQSVLSRADQLYYRLESLLSLLGGCVILMLVFMAVANILGRWFFDLPVSGYIDWVEQGMAFMAFLGLSYTQRDGGHIRMDILIGQLKGRWLWAVELFTVLVMLVLSVLLMYGSYKHFNRAFVNGDTSFDIGLVTWPSKLVVPIALGLLCLRLILQAWGYSRALISGSPNPVAVPLVESAAVVAAREAATVATASFDIDENTNPEQGKDRV
jgi:TRAP-type C4-dicarboxylate transport system permease small subunit